MTVQTCSAIRCSKIKSFKKHRSLIKMKRPKLRSMMDTLKISKMLRELMVRGLKSVVQLMTITRMENVK